MTWQRRSPRPEPLFPADALFLTGAFGPAAALCPAVALCLAAALCLPSLAAAQSATFRIPPSNALPNYDRSSIGQREAIEGNAYVARTNDAGANWYNPAGLAQSEKSALNASANGYEVTRYALEGLEESPARTRFASIGTYFGGVLGAPVVKSEKLRLGFSYTKAVNWNPSRIEGEFETAGPGGDESFLYSSYVNFTTEVPGIGAGYRVSERFRLGFGAGCAITSLYQNSRISDRLVNGASASSDLRSLETDGSAMSILLTGSAQVDLRSGLRVGALVTAPGMGISGSSRIAYQATAISGPASADLAFRDGEADFEYKIPLRATVGAAVRLGRGEIEVDFKYHGSTDRYEILSSEETAALVSTDSTGVSSEGSVAFDPVIEEARAIYNWAVGGNYPLSQTVRLHAGFFTDNSPVANPEASLFRKLDLVGGSLGTSIDFGKLSGSVGITGSWGTSEERAVGPTLGGAAATTRTSVRTFNLLYAVSYAF
jgi:hypothetical protein